MARYRKVFPQLDSAADSFARVRQFLESKGFKYRNRDGEQVFQKGDGVWVAASFIKIAYAGSEICLEAWIDAMGAEQDLEGFVGCAAKKPLKKVVVQVESILNTPNPNYVPGVQEEAVEVPAADVAEVQLPEGITKKEYFEKYAGESFYRDIKIAAIVAYICAGINAVIAIALNPLALLDSVILVALALGLHLKKSKACAIAITVYAAFVMVLGLVTSGSVSGWMWLVVGVISLIAFKNAEKRYHQLTGK